MTSLSASRVANKSLSRSLIFLSRQCSNRRSIHIGPSASAPAIQEYPTRTPPPPTVHFTPRKSLLPDALPFRAFLEDTHGRFHNYLRISVTERCNLRCTYCMPSEGIDLTPSEKLLSTQEIIQLAKLFVQEGVTKIRLTGGEPTVRKDIVELVEELGKLRAFGLKDIALTSNGIALWRKLERMAKGGLTHVNLSLDTLDPFKYQIMTRRTGMEVVLKTLDTALSLGIKSVKLNCVVIKDLNDSEILDFVALTKDKPIEVRFIEFMPFDGNKWNSNKMVPYQTLVSRISEVYPGVNPIPHAPGETSKTYLIPSHSGRIGFISSMTDHFCGTCNRLRITADGNLKVCLFGNDEVSLRDLMRQGAGDDELLKVIGNAVGKKKKEHAGMEELKDMKNRSMIRIGG